MPSSARSSAPSIPPMSKARSTLCLPRRRRRPSPRSAPPVRSRPSFHPTQPPSLLATTGDAFTQAMGTGLLVAAALAGAMAVVVIRFLPARESVEASSREPRSAPDARARASRQSVRKAGVWMILAALVLGAAYLASRPGSDTPAANGHGSAPKFAADRALRSGRDGGAADPRTRARHRRERPDHLPPRLRQGGRLRAAGDAADALHHRLAQQVVHRAGDHAARRGGEGRARRARAALPAVVPRRGRGSFRGDHRPPPPEPDERPVDQDRADVPGQRRHQRRRAGEDSSQAEQRRADGTGRQDPPVQHRSTTRSSG